MILTARKWLSALLLVLATASPLAATSRDQSFDSNWRFLRADAPGAENPAFNDSAWRTLDLPHDWSIEDLPPATNHVGPFAPDESAGLEKTGYVVGGIGWYRKHFTLNETNQLVTLRFDGVYMNAEFWLNGHRLGEHPYGYTSFEFDLTPYLNAARQDNVLAVRVRNEGQNTRWYSGSGIYRHTWLTVTDPVHILTWGVFVTTPEVSRDKALVKIATEVYNSGNSATYISVRTRVLDANGKIFKTFEAHSPFLAGERISGFNQIIEVPSPKLWSPDSPNLYSAEIEIVAAGKLVDTVSTHFGIRKIEVDAEHGLRLNGEPLKLRGGCMHHDNGPLGSAAIDRAEERRVELVKANGFNAIRTSHNPPSPAFLDACDRLGILVIDEAFDQWNEAKIGNGSDYHLYFKDWHKRDIGSMVQRDRNHPSIIMWSIGNEIPEQFHAEATAKELRDVVLFYDTTRPITQAICSDWDSMTVAHHWDQLSDPAFVNLDVAGYNYLPDKYESDHARHPDRVMMATESFPNDSFRYWSLVEKHPYIIGDFTWTAMDYLGESGIGHSVLSNEKDSFFRSWPWYDAWCGDIDVCGFKKPQSYYRDVVWRRSPIEIAVHSPIPQGITEHVSGWGWPDESQSWNWSGHEGHPMQVSVYSRCDTVRLELNGKPIGEKPVSDATRLTARFDVPYAPGELRAIGLVNGKIVATKTLQTTGAAKRLKLTADRSTIRSDRNDLCYVTVEVVDASGRRVPDAEIPVQFSVSGVGELAAQGSGAPNKPASFHVPQRTTFEGRCLAILRPIGSPGKITLQAEAQGLQADRVSIWVR
jgi:beta-galactosidase